jgi:anaerobic dimethyl sulfoxide reductase subunit A
MSEKNLLNNLVNSTVMSRRSFMKWSAALGGTAAVLANGGLPLSRAQNAGELGSAFADGGNVYRCACPAHNCGGRCPLLVHVRDGVITRISSDDSDYDEIDKPRVLACTRGRSYRRRQYHPDRLKYPMKRVGPRGSGEFEQISWDEALDTIASEMQRIKDAHGNQAFFVPYGTGGSGGFNGRGTAMRLMNLFGGSLNFYNNYSWAATQVATPIVYGTQSTGGQRQDWVNTRYIIMWGWNPSEMIDGTNTAWFVKKARENGAKVISIDPRQSLSTVALADEWIPIRPGTDAAMLTAMAYVIVTEDLHDKDFVERCCVGFDSSQMPEGYEDEESYVDYLMGTVDGVPKTPEWAEAITAVPAAKIAQIAREYATVKPAMMYQGYGMQRREWGEEAVRAGCVLPAITGNVGISGGWAGGIAFQVGGGAGGAGFPSGSNPISASIPSVEWHEAVLRGTEMGPEDGLRGVDQLDTNIKMIYAVASNCLINQHPNINRTAEILADESLCEFVLVNEHFMTSTAKFADILLPAAMPFEFYGITGSWKYGEEAMFQRKLLDPPFETMSDFDICAAIADRLGLGEEYTEGLSNEEWMQRIVGLRHEANPDFPTWEQLMDENAGFYQRRVEEASFAFKDFREDPEENPLDTPSGKIEIFSAAMFDREDPERIPAVPKYIPEVEGPFGPTADRFPLQLMGHHYMPRVHSTHDENPWVMEAFPQRLFINPIDARERNIKDGDMVKVWNDYGTVMIPVRVTNKIMPGVVDLPQGAWYDPDENGVDRGGCVNTLTSYRMTPIAFGNTQHSIVVQVEKA